MMHSPPAKKQDTNTYGSAPDLHLGADTTLLDAQNSTTRSLKRPRCDCSPSQVSKLDSFINTLSTWRDETNSKLSCLQDCMNEIKTQNKQLISSNAEIEKSIEFLALKYDDLCLQMNGFQDQTKTWDERLLKNENNIEELDRISRLSTIEIRNLPLKNRPSEDDLVAYSLRIFKELSVDVAMSDIYDIRCVTTKSVNKSILVKLNSVLLKNKLLKAFRDYNRLGSNRKLNSSILGSDFPQQQLIYMSENLTFRTRRLFHLARDLVKTNVYKHCWTANGYILLRKEDNGKPILLTSEVQLTELQSKN